MQTCRILVFVFALLGAGCCCQEPALTPATPATPAESTAPSAPPTPEPVAAPDAAPKNTIKWSTASEVNNFGYDIFRGDNEEGPFERINAEVVPGGGTTDEPRYYQYADEKIDPKRDYFYYVESISMDGEREKFTPIAKAPAKEKP